MRNIGVVRNAALTLCAIAVVGCGGGGGGGGSTAAPSASAPPPPAPTSATNPPPTVTVPAPPSLAGPSVLPGGTAGRFEGASLPAGQSLTIVVRKPDGSESSLNTVVDAEGRVSQEITPAASGVHTLRVMDASGKELISVDFNAL